MTKDFTLLLILAALLVLAYFIGLWHGRRVERKNATQIGPLPSNTRTQDGPPPKNRV